MPVFSSLIVIAPLSKIKLSIICVGLFLDSILIVSFMPGTQCLHYGSFTIIVEIG